MSSLEEIVSRMVPRTREQIVSGAIRKHEYNQDYFQKTKGSQYPREKQYRKRLRQEMVQAYGGVCIGCGEKDHIVLVLDHKNDDAQIDRLQNGHKGGYRLYAYLRKLGWPKDHHQLLCHNCNFRKEYYRRQGCPQRVLRRRV